MVYDSYRVLPKKQPTNLKSGEERQTPLVTQFQCCVTAVLGEAFKKTAILAPAIEKQWLATLRQGVRGLPVDVETLWSMALLFEEPGMMFCFFFNGII